VSRPAEEILEFDKLRDLLRGHTTSAPGQRAVDALAFRTSRQELDLEFVAVAEAMACLRAGSEIGFGALADPQPWLARISMPGALLEPAGLLDVASLVDTSAWLKDFFREAAPQFPLLASRARSLADFRPLAAAIRRAILPNGEISDDASPALRRIRAGIARTRETIQKTMERILHGRGATGENYVTRRNERFVIPVRASERHAVDGVVHAASASGQTVFVEPLAAIEFNNRLVQLSEEEAAEIARILDELTQRVAAEQAPLSHAVATIAEMDSLFARGRFARQFDACIPEFAAPALNNGVPTASAQTPGAPTASAPTPGVPTASAPTASGLTASVVNAPLIALDAARHPVLEATLRPQGRAVVPLTLSLGGAETVLVISGPNTGGKTVALKTVGIAVLSAQSGIPVAAQSARLSLFDRVLTDVGDEQSMAADLSTFSAHMLNLKSMLATLTEQSLVLVDEMGTGTAPEEGAALAIALLDEFLARRCLVLATTHHDRLKSYASTTPGVLNAAVEFDEERLAPTYRLRVGVPGGSSGIAIALRLGLPQHIIDHAAALLAPESREAAGLIAYLHRSRDTLEQMQRDLAEQARRLEDERRTLREEWVARQRQRIAELEKRFADALTEHERELTRVLEAVKDAELRAKLEKQTRRKAGQARSEARSEADAAVVAHLSESQPDLGIAAEIVRPPNDDELLPGVRVRVRGFSAPLVLRRRDRGTAEVEAGPLRMKVPLAEIIAIVAEEPAKPGSRTPPSGIFGAPAGRTSGAPPPPGTAAARRSSNAPNAPNARNASNAPNEDDPAGRDEINLIGCTVEEATRRADKFIDNAALAGKPQVRVIHGHGTGALRRGLAQFFSTHPLVERIHAEADERGGAAVTVVELKE
jgi:DNA mismatch repair protein MutS2